MALEIASGSCSIGFELFYFAGHQIGNTDQNLFIFTKGIQTEFFKCALTAKSQTIRNKGIQSSIFNFNS